MLVSGRSLSREVAPIATMRHWRRVDARPWRLLLDVMVFPSL